MLSTCKPEEWTLEEIQRALSNVNGDPKRKIVIPMFQRGLRWDEKKEETFIDSLIKHYPIGSLLFYRTFKDDIEYYTLIDGLQRGNTIRAFFNDPTRFFEPHQIPDTYINCIYNNCGASGNETTIKEKIKSITTDYIKTNKIDDLSELKLYSELKKQFPYLVERLLFIQDEMQAFMHDYKKQYDELKSTKIPVIIYSGEEYTLPDIFNRINSKGVPLSQYEIYAASWPREKFHINNDEILGYVQRRFNAFVDDDYKIEGYDPVTFKKNGLVNAFEYVFGLSKYLYKQYPILSFGGNMGDDEINHMAFELLNACFFTQHKDIERVHEVIIKFKDDIDRLENCLNESIKFVNDCIAVITKFKGNKRSSEERIFHSQWQIMSYVSFVFRERYDIETLKAKKDEWSSVKKVLKDSLWKYYVYDIVSEFWDEGATRKIHACNAERRYFSNLTSGMVSSSLDAYFERTKARKEKGKVAAPSSKDYVILNTIYLNSFNAMDQLSVDNFDIEHICTKNQLKKHIINSEGEGLPISSIANLCYLPEHENRSKGEYTFYQDSVFLKNSNYTLAEIEEKFSLTKKEDVEWMDLDFSKGDYESLKNFYSDFLDERYKRLKKLFVDNMNLAS